MSDFFSTSDKSRKKQRIRQLVAPFFCLFLRSEHPLRRISTIKMYDSRRQKKKKNTIYIRRVPIFFFLPLCCLFGQLTVRVDRIFFTVLSAVTSLGQKITWETQLLQIFGHGIVNEKSLESESWIVTGSSDERALSASY